MRSLLDRDGIYSVHANKARRLAPEIHLPTSSAERSALLPYVSCRQPPVDSLQQMLSLGDTARIRSYVSSCWRRQHAAASLLPPLRQLHDH